MTLSSVMQASCRCIQEQQIFYSLLIMMVVCECVYNMRILCLKNNTLDF